jgi:hypothetical protein
MRNSRLFWACVLILVGVVLLLGNFGFLDNLNINIWGLIWPLVLIAAGAWIVAGYLRRPASPAVEELAIPLQDAASAEITLDHGAGSLTVAAGTAPDEVAWGSFTGGLDQRARLDGQVLKVEMSVPHDAGANFPFGWNSGGLDWNLRLNQGIPLTLNFNTGASRSQIDLSDLLVTAVKLETGASATDITLPQAAGLTGVRIQSGAAQVVVRVPGGVAARIQAEAGLAHVDVDATRFLQVGPHSYESPDFATAANKADIDVHTGVGSVRIV